ncbi:MAG: hypothetical protein ACYDAK_02915 [Candidatus Limnocylindrales bacterium]
MTEQTSPSTVEDGRHQHTTDFTVDGEELTTTERELTPRQIMEMASIDPQAHYLVQIEGRHRESYQGKEDTLVHIRDDAKFITVSTGPTPVS